MLFITIVKLKSSSFFFCFFKACIVEIQIFSVGFSCSVTLKSIGVSCTLNDLLPSRDSVT